jgi:tetratricopeptide (TPR) repeat protein
MEQQDKRLENLHQQASTLYLQGEYVAALSAWRQLLQLDPQDERAREGVRLCELLVQEEGGTVPPVHVEPPPPPKAGASVDDSGSGVGFGIGEDLDEELDELDEMLGDGGSTDWMDKPPEAPPATSGGALDFDLSEAAESPDADFNLDAADRPAGGADAGQDQTASEIDAAFNFESTAPPEAAAAPPDAAALPSNISAEELQRRADELMAEALEHYENGRRTDALSVLDRLAILDENNQAAMTFANHIRAEIEAQSPSPAAPAAAPDGEEELLADAVFEPSQEAAPAPRIDNGMIDLEGQGGESLGLGGPEVPPRPEANAEVQPAAPPSEEFDLGEVAVGESLVDTTVQGEAEPTPAPAAGSPPKPRLNKWMMVAAVVVLALGGGYLALQFLGGSSSVESGNTALAAPPPLGEPERPGSGSETPATSKNADPAPDSPSNAAATPPPGDLDEILDRADAAYEEGDYAVAVLAYNDALKIDPRNEVARRRLEEAGELYREQKELIEQRQQIIQAFNEGDYRNALSILYRIPPENETEAERFERYKFNGWYNMGLRALKTGDCRLARSNLREAQQVDPTDRDLQYALELSVACFENQDQSYFDATGSMRLRALDD